VARKYGGVVPIVRVANRATWVIGRDGRIQSLITGGEAIDPTQAISACGSGR